MYYHEFSNKIVVVTGATRGIGKAITGRFLDAGATVIGIYANNTQAASNLMVEHEKNRNNLNLIRCNIADEQEVDTLFRSIENKHETIDILVNNAGIRKDAVLAMMNFRQWQDVLDVNLSGTFLMSKQAVLLMMKKKYGRIINITSPVSHLGFPGQANYASSKAGQVALTKSLAKEVARKKITVNCVSPGFIDTDFLTGLSPALLEEYKKMVPMRRFGTADEVAEAVLFLASENSSYISGTVLDVNGGL